MANSLFAYVRKYELPDPLLPGAFIVFRLDGHAFHRFSEVHNFGKPNDLRALQLMDHAATAVMEEYPDIILAFGESDEYSFLLRRQTTLYNRRQAKIVSTLTSYFTSCYVFYWSQYFPDTPLRYPPSFDGRIILYPTQREIRDYFAWRQADTHINNLYNTAFWALVQQGGETTTQAHATLRGTLSKDKHEILFGRFNMNYNEIDERFKKGSILVRQEIASSPPTSGLKEQTGNDPGPSTGPPDRKQTEGTDGMDDPPPKAEQKEASKKKKGEARQTKIELLHCDIIKDAFWDSRPRLLA
ncbi:Thg1 C terminal domain-containing protein [Amanita rubescens]|nr:Thg1 C terminal domain-containing protein [Amanita rubescens]KAF8344707.1 Thg1 C terminal domain-containing protein [Amanita rubescens]